METQYIVRQPLPVIADVPTPEPGLGFQEYAEAIAAAIRGGQPPQFTVGLYGAWGSGKSSLLNAVSRALARNADALATEADDIVTVYFDAWRYEKTEHIIVPMLHTMHSAIRDSGDHKVADTLQRAIRSVIYSLNFSIRYIGGVELKPKDIRDNWQSEGLPALDEAFSGPFNELRNITQVLGDKRIVILIDDLDRCSPDKVVSVLESINLVMDVPGLIFVLALDYDILARAITYKYPHASGDAFIQKMVQLPFRVPPLNLERANFLSSILPKWLDQSSSLPRVMSSEAFSSHLRDVANLGLDANPRQIKRLINSFLLLQRIVISRGLAIDYRLLLTLVGIQLSWPDYYQRFREAVVSEDVQDPFKVLTEAEEKPALGRYAKRLLSTDVSEETLRQIFELAAVVHSDQRADTSPFDPFAGNLDLSPPQRVEHNRKALRDELSFWGFENIPSDPNYFYSDQMPNVRFYFGPNAVRFDKKEELDVTGNRKWKTWEVYSLINEAHLALQVIQDPNRRFKGS